MYSACIKVQTWLFYLVLVTATGIVICLYEFANWYWTVVCICTSTATVNLNIELVCMFNVILMLCFVLLLCRRSYSTPLPHARQHARTPKVIPSKYSVSSVCVARLGCVCACECIATLGCACLVHGSNWYELVLHLPVNFCCSLVWIRTAPCPELILLIDVNC